MTDAVERSYRRVGTYRVEISEDGSVSCTRNGKPVEFRHLPRTIRREAEALQRSL